MVADDQSFSLYQKQESYAITYTNPIATAPASFEIVEGTLPSSITFNNSTGTFTGKGLTDSDHVYNIKVKISSSSEIVAPTTINVTINTYKTARISIPAKTHEYITNVMPQTSTIPYTSDESVTFQIKSGTLPTGITFDASLPGFVYNTTYITQDINTSVVINGYSEHNQTGVDSTQTIIVRKNAIQSNNQAFIFYSALGQKSKSVSYSGSLAPVQDATFALSGTLPSGVTFNTSTGTFTSDGTQTTTETQTVQVTISSINNTSTSKTIEVTLTVDTNPDITDPIIEDGLTFFQPFNIDYITPQVGNNMTLSGVTPTLETINNIDCLTLNGQQCLYDNTSQYWTGVTRHCPNMSWSVWVLIPTIDSSINTKFVFFGLENQEFWGNGHDVEIQYYDNGLYHLYTSHVLSNFVSPVIANTWYNFAATYESGIDQFKVYLNGTLKATASRPGYSQMVVPFIGILCQNIRGTITPVDYSFSISRLRIYNRTLSASEVLQLAQEFN